MGFHLAAGHMLLKILVKNGFNLRNQFVGQGGPRTQGIGPDAPHHATGRIDDVHAFGAHTQPQVPVGHRADRGHVLAAQRVARAVAPEDGVDEAGLQVVTQQAAARAHPEHIGTVLEQRPDAVAVQPVGAADIAVDAADGQCVLVDQQQALGHCPSPLRSAAILALVGGEGYPGAAERRTPREGHMLA